MRRLAALVLVLAGTPLAGPTLAQQGGPEGRKTAVARPAPVIGCTSLANLRALERDTGTDTGAALAVIGRPSSDLGCAEIDPGRVTAVTDHVALGGQAYDCLSLQGTLVCHWAQAGRLTPVAAPATKPRPAEKSRR